MSNPEESLLTACTTKKAAFRDSKAHILAYSFKKSPEVDEARATLLSNKTLGRAEKLQLFELSMQDHPNGSGVGQVLVESGELAMAREYFEMATAQNPKNADAPWGSSSSLTDLSRRSGSLRTAMPRLWPACAA